VPLIPYAHLKLSHFLSFTGTCEASMSHGLADMHAIGYRDEAIICHQPGNGAEMGHDDTTAQPSALCTSPVAMDLPSISSLGSMLDLVHEDDSK